MQWVRQKILVTEARYYNLGVIKMGKSIKKEPDFDPSDVKVYNPEYNYIRIVEIIGKIKSADYYVGDLSDIGNSIGIIIGKYICDDMGFEEDSFIHGFKHGVSLSNGTHP